MTTSLIPEVGTRVKPVLVPGITEALSVYPWVQDVTEVVVTEHATKYTYTEVGGAWADRPVVYADFTNPKTGDTCNWYMSVWETLDLPADGSTLTVSETVDEIAGIRIPKNANEGDLRAVIERLANDLGEAHRQRDSIAEQRDGYRTSVNNAHTAIEWIGNRLIEESEHRGWCETFDSLIEEANSTLSQWGYELPIRQREFDVEVTITGTITTTYTHTVTARNEDDARDVAERDIRYGDVNLDSELTEAARNESFEDIDWSIDDVSVA